MNDQKTRNDASGTLSDAERQFYGQVVREVFQRHGISSTTPWDQIGERRQMPHMDVAEAVIAEFVGNTDHQDFVEATFGKSPTLRRFFKIVPNTIDEEEE